MPGMKLVALCVLAALALSEGTSAALRRTAAQRAKTAGELLGENKAANHFFKTFLGALPKNVTKAKQEAVIESLEAEVSKLSENVVKLKSLSSAEEKNKGHADLLKSSLKGKDRAMMENMDEWSQRMNEKAKVGAMDVMSKLKNAIHLIKKGALSGNADAEKKLGDVLQHMSAMAR
jgi:hypothetical protein